MSAGSLVYLSGPPGVGKSALMAELTAGYLRAHLPWPFARDVLVGDGADVAAVEVGGRPPGRDTYPGTDVLSMGIAPSAAAWIAGRPAALVLGEGDRLAIARFLGAAATAGYAVTLVDLTLPDAVLAARRAGRGSEQNESWCRGRATKAANLAASATAAGWTLLRVTTDRPPPALAAEVRAAVPALAAHLPARAAAR